MNIRRPVVLGIVRSYKTAVIAPFVVSLRRTGYTGDIAFFVDDLAPDTLEFLYEHGVSIQPLPPRYFIQARRHLLRAVAAMAPMAHRHRVQIELSRYYLHLNDARWPCYYDFLLRTRGLYSHVMFSDIKDVVFQKPPFEFDWRAPFCTAVQAPNTLIREDDKTIGWIRQGYGNEAARRLADKPAICSGVTFAEIDVAIDYVRMMCEDFIRINVRGLVDQGVHNYLIYSGKIKSSYVFNYLDTPMLHLGTMDAGDLKVNDEGQALDGSGAVANVVHQYAKHYKAMSQSLDLAARV